MLKTVHKPKKLSLIKRRTTSKIEGCKVFYYLCPG